MNYLKITQHDIANGPGVRVVLWVSGCTCYCNECHNQESWDFNSGIEFNREALQDIFNSLAPDYVQGLTLSGGHPLEDQNCETILELVKIITAKYPEKNIWLYTGYRYEDIMDDKSAYGIIRQQILSYCDVLVDGRFEIENKNITLNYRGSSNQRVIDLHNSTPDNVCLWQERYNTI